MNLMAEETNPSIVFEGKNPKFTAKAREVLPWLVKYAEAQKPVEYGVLGKAVDVDPHVELDRILGIIGEALKKSAPDIPMIQLIVINKQGIVGNSGLGWLVPKERIPRLSQEEKKELCEEAQQKVFEWRHWGEILAKCHLEALPLGAGAPLGTLLEEAAASIPYGATEGEDHRILKEYVKAYPGCIDLKQQFTHRSTECMLLSGDEMDVFLESPTELICVEVKGKKSCLADIRRVIFQCVKYRAVLEAQQLYRNDKKKPVISVYLVLATDLSEELKRVAELLKIPVKTNVAVPQSFVAPDKNSHGTAGYSARSVTFSGT